MTTTTLIPSLRPAGAKPAPWPLALARRLALGTGVAGTILAGMIVFGVSPPPPTMHAVNDIAAEAALREPIAPVQRFAARDGTMLAYRSYLPTLSAPPPIVAVLIHGSGGSSVNMNVLGRALAARRPSPRTSGARAYRAVAATSITSASKKTTSPTSSP
jgi:hypothetical protein